MKMYHISWMTGAMLFALPAWAQDDGAGGPAAEEMAPSLLEVQPDDRVLGDRDAPVTIVEFASLTCPHCATFHIDTLPEVKSELIDTGRANLVLRHFPLDQLALSAAVVADCAPATQYYPLLDVLFVTQEDWTSADNPLRAVQQSAMLAGLPESRLAECLQDEAAIDTVLATRLRAQAELSVQSTPTFFVNGMMIRGAQPYDVFATAVAEAAAAAPASTPEADASAESESESESESEENMTE